MPIADRKYKRFTPKNVKRSPRKRGVYALYADRTLIFLGQAKGQADTIRSRLLVHLRESANGATRYKREPARSPEARLRALLQEYVAAHGRPPAGNLATS